MDTPSDSSKGAARAMNGGFSPRSAAGGFFVSLKSLFWPAGTGQRAAPSAPSAPVELPRAPLQTLSAMPQATPRDSRAGHPLRRVAGSAGRWKKRLVEAKATWPRATVDELIATDGHIRKLSALIQERYGLGREAAERQVLRFLGEHDGRL